MSSALHSVLFPLDFTLNDIIDFLQKHNMKPIKPIREGERGKYKRVRIRDPKLFKSFITKKLNNGVSLVIGYY